MAYELMEYIANNLDQTLLIELYKNLLKPRMIEENMLFWFFTMVSTSCSMGFLDC
ncbi:hypothetical protein [Tamlana flava]|uniref:hypothetical protein n=1 Tax=Tamlana flava TaxID=3158572 RepID=UPI00351BB72A